jgi:hypothetical protein
MIKKITVILYLIASMVNAGETLDLQSENSIFVLLPGAENFIERAFKVDPQTDLGKKYVQVAVGFVRQEGEFDKDFFYRMEFPTLTHRRSSKKELFRDRIRSEIVDFLKKDLKNSRADQVFTTSVLDAFNGQSYLVSNKSN